MVGFIVDGMNHATANDLDGPSNYLAAERIAAAILGRRPGLADRLHVDESRATVRLDLDNGRAIIGGRIRNGDLLAWSVVTPDMPLDASFGTGDYPGGSIATWMINEFDRLTPTLPR